jgi:hypothetical protein
MFLAAEVARNQALRIFERIAAPCDAELLVLLALPGGFFMRSPLPSPRLI